MIGTAKYFTHLIQDGWTPIRVCANQSTKEIIYWCSEYIDTNDTEHRWDVYYDRGEPMFLIKEKSDVTIFMLRWRTE